MAAHTPHDLALGDAFLASLKSESVDSQDECPICATRYSDSQEKHITTGCGHPYHPSCLGTWLQEQQTAWATCPMCRTKLFHRPDFEEHMYEDHFFDDDGYLSDDDDYLRDPPGWEGLWTAYAQINDVRKSITEIIRYIWTNVERLRWIDTWEAAHWEPFVTATLDACGVSIGGETWQPCSAEEFVLVRSIIDLLAGFADAKGRNTEELRKMLYVLDEHEEAADYCTVEQAYEAAGLHELFPECALSTLFAEGDELEGDIAYIDWEFERLGIDL